MRLSSIPTIKKRERAKERSVITERLPSLSNGSKLALWTEPGVFGPFSWVGMEKIQRRLHGLLSTKTRSLAWAEVSVLLGLALGFLGYSKAKLHLSPLDGMGGEEVMKHKGQDPGQVDGTLRDIRELSTTRQRSSVPTGKLTML